jgi:nucleoside-diphosphate-sugar epimerase
MYGVTKLFGELMGRFYNKKFDLDFRAVRFPPIISPGVKTMAVAQCIPWSIEHAAKGEPYDLWLEPTFKVGILYYKDAARALTMVHDAPREKITTMCYNVAGDYLSSMQEFVDTIKKHISGAEIGFNPDPDIMKALGSEVPPMDDSKAREEWNWEARYILDAMIEDFIKELQTNESLYQ